MNRPEATAVCSLCGLMKRVCCGTAVGSERTYPEDGRNYCHECCDGKASHREYQQLVDLGLIVPPPAAPDWATKEKQRGLEHSVSYYRTIISRDDK